MPSDANILPFTKQAVGTASVTGPNITSVTGFPRRGFPFRINYTGFTYNTTGVASFQVFLDKSSDGTTFISGVAASDPVSINITPIIAGETFIRGNIGAQHPIYRFRYIPTPATGTLTGTLQIDPVAAGV